MAIASRSEINRLKVLKAIEINEISREKFAELIGYSFSQIQGICMPDRESTRAVNATDRLIVVMNANLARNGYQTVE